MKHLLLELLGIVILAGCLPAQQPVITAEMKVDHDTLSSWLHSSDPRLVAWAADFARRNHDAKLIASMPELLQHLSIPADKDPDESEAARGHAVLAILDTLIQENSEVPVSAIDKIAPSFPAEAAILISRLPLSASRAILDGWTYGKTGRYGGLLARIASMILAKDPVPSHVFFDHKSVGFVASVVNASEDNIHITVQAGNSTGGAYGTGTCGDALGYPLAPGWPQIYSYGLSEAIDQQVKQPIVLELADDQIYYERRKVNEGWGSCYENEVAELNPWTRHRLLAYWLGISEGQVSWQPANSFTIVWRNKPAYQAQLGRIIEAERLKLHTTVESLRQRGFLKPDETAMPRLGVTIVCDMKPCPLR